MEEEEVKISQLRHTIMSPLAGLMMGIESGQQATILLKRVNTISERLKLLFELANIQDGECENLPDEVVLDRAKKIVLSNNL